jgi:hypothetical protein
MSRLSAERPRYLSMSAAYKATKDTVMQGGRCFTVVERDAAAFNYLVRPGDTLGDTTLPAGAWPPAAQTPPQHCQPPQQ